MKGVFKITHAEFTKIFKKPIVYIMAFVLALTAVLSIMFFKPNVRADNSVALDANNAQGCYNLFYGTGDDSKRTYNDVYTSAKNSIIVYKCINARNNNLDSAIENYNNAFTNLQTFDPSSVKEDTVEDNKTSLINGVNAAIEDVLNTFVDISANDVLKNYFGEDISSFTSYDYLKQLMGLEDYYKTHFIDTEKYYSYDTIKKAYENNLKTTTDRTEYLDYINTNKFGELLNALSSYGKKLIYNNLLDFISSIEKQQNDFINGLAQSQTDDQKKQCSAMLDKLKQLVSEFQATPDLWSNADTLLIIGTKSEYNVIKDVCGDIIAIIDNAAQNKNSDDSDKYTQQGKKDCANALKESNHIKRMQDYVKSLTFLNVSDDLIAEFNTISEKVEANQKTILDNIDSLKGEASTSEISTEITNYKVLGETYQSLVNQLVFKQCSKIASVDKMRNCRSASFDLSDYNTYENNQNISRNKYQINNNIYSNTLGNVFSFGTTSTYEKSVYDCIYFTLKICTILVVVFTIMMISGLVTSETENGTIKLLLIRPYRRSKILIGKMLATLFFSIIFILLSVVLSATVGYFMYGVPTMGKIMVTFNATKTFLISPIWLILLFIGSCILDVIFYLLLSLTISVLFRSYIGAITTSFLIYVGSIVVGAFIPTSPVYAYLPFTNTSLFRYFGGELLGSITTKASLFISTPVQSYQSFLTSILITGITSILLFTTTLVTFNRRDF